jgi:hypothetical protein
MASPVPMIGAIVRKNGRLGKVNGVGKPFPGGALAVYVLGVDSEFADWWLLKDITIESEEVPVSQARSA